MTTGNDGTGHLQISRPGNYPNRLTLDVTATGSTLVYDGDIYTGNGNIAGWTINSTQLVSPAGYVTLDYANGVVFNVYDYGASLGVSDGFSGLNNRMISYVSNTEILHRFGHTPTPWHHRARDVDGTRWQSHRAQPAIDACHCHR